MSGFAANYSCRDAGLTVSPRDVANMSADGYWPLLWIHSGRHVASDGAVVLLLPQITCLSIECPVFVQRLWLCCSVCRMMAVYP